MENELKIDLLRCCSFSLSFKYGCSLLYKKKVHDISEYQIIRFRL